MTYTTDLDTPCVATLDRQIPYTTPNISRTDDDMSPHKQAPPRQRLRQRRSAYPGSALLRRDPLRRITRAPAPPIPRPSLGTGRPRGCAHFETPPSPAVAVGAVGTTRSPAVRTPALPCDQNGPSREGTRGVSHAPKQPPRAPSRSPGLAGWARRRRSGCLRIADLSFQVSGRERRARPRPCRRSPVGGVERRTLGACSGGRPTTARAPLRMRQRTAVLAPH
jgi:hypothetical protein